MGATLAEKVLARTAGLERVQAGQDIEARPDAVVVYDFPGYTDVTFRQMREEFGVRQLASPERYAVFIDHFVPSANPKDEAFHAGTRAWGREQGVPVVERRGIGHQVAAEMGYAMPGALVVHFDGHISQLGAFGTLAIGLRRNVLEAFVRDAVSLRVPHTTRVNLHGRLPEGVMARDVFHHLVRQLGPSSCRFQVLEFGGEGLRSISLEGRQSLCGLAMFTGALTAVINPDQAAIAYARGRAQPHLRHIEPVSSDLDANYAAVHEIDLDRLEPLVVCPPNPANTRDLHELAGLQVQNGYLGSCVSGRLEDLRIAARILQGRRVHDGFSLHVVPTSQEIMAAAAAEGLIATLAEAGAFVSSPSCDFCAGRLGAMAAGQRAVSTGTLNVPGRMGSPEAEIYLCSAATVAASALAGRIADPRPLLQAGVPA